MLFDATQAARASPATLGFVMQRLRRKERKDRKAEGGGNRPLPPFPSLTSSPHRRGAGVASTSVRILPMRTCLFVVALVLFIPIARADDAADAKAIVEKAIKATGVKA